MPTKVLAGRERSSIALVALELVLVLALDDVVGSGMIRVASVLMRCWKMVDFCTTCLMVKGTKSTIYGEKVLLCKMQKFSDFSRCFISPFD